jgi:hypothetical protein
MAAGCQSASRNADWNASKMDGVARCDETSEKTITCVSQNLGAFEDAEVFAEKRVVAGDQSVGRLIGVAALEINRADDVSEHEHGVTPVLSFRFSCHGLSPRFNDARFQLPLTTTTLGGDND